MRTSIKLFALLCLVTASACALDISRHGIAWTIADASVASSGTYANGDPWVVPTVPVTGITITAISPASTQVSGRTQHGSMLNPMPNTRDQSNPSAYDSELRYGAFNASLNVGRPGGNAIGVGNPLVVPAGSSLMSSRTNDTPDSRPQLVDLAVLTVVASPPPAGSFRPPYCGTDKTHAWNMSQIDYSKLQSLPRASVSDEPSLATVSANLERVWNEQDTEYTGEYLRATNNGESYGRNLCYQLSPALLSLQLDYTDEEKETLLIRVLQYGIDIYGVAVNGGVWYNNGGHAMGRKAVLGLTARVLGDDAMLAYLDAGTHFIFQEDQQTWYIEQADVGKYVVSTEARPRETYLQEDVGLPEWGINHYTAEEYDGRNWDVVYRDNVLSSVMPGVLVARLMGLRATWNWQPLFDYVDRGVEIEQGRGPSNIGGTNELQTFDNNFWNAFRYAEPLPEPGGGETSQTTQPTFATVTPGTYDSTQNVSITCSSPSPSIYYTTDSSAPTTGSTLYSGAIEVAATTRIRAIATSAGLTTSEELDGTFTITCVPPSASIGSGSYSGAQTVTLSTTTSGATIRYTLDGSDVTSESTAYTSPLLIGSTATLKARTYKSGLTESAQRDWTYAISGGTQGDPFLEYWQEVGLAFTGNFIVQWTVDGVPSGAFDAVVNLSPATGVDAYADGFAQIRFWTDGTIQARNGSAYGAAATVNYAQGVTYAFRMAVNFTAKTYDVWVTPSNGSETQIADDYAFRTDQSSASAVAAFAWISNTNGVPVYIQDLTSYLEVVPVRVRRGGPRSAGVMVP